MISNEQQLAINDILSVMGDKKMFLSEKKLYINAIDKLYNLGYYKGGKNHNEKVSLYVRFI